MASFRKLPVMALLLLAECLCAQPKKAATMPRPPRSNQNVVDRLSRMPEAQRQRVLAKLPPDRRARIENRLEKYNQLPQAEKDRLRAQAESFQSLPPEKQEAVRTNFRNFRNLPDDRRAPVREELRQLRGMSDEERKARMDSDEFRSKYSAGERQILENLSTLVPQQ
jgi:hypothetical protein